MTTLVELQASVLDLTKNPAVANITSMAMRDATLRAHHTDFFPRDLLESTLSYEVSSAISYSFPDVLQSLSRARNLKAIYGDDPTTQQRVEEFEYRELDDLYDRDGLRRPSIFTLTGNTLRVYPQQATGLLAVFYYANPNVTGLEYSSWIADLYPDQVAQWAAAIVFARTGYLEQAKSFQEEYVKPFKDMLIQSHLTGTRN